MIPARQTWPPNFAVVYRERGYWRGGLIGDLIRPHAAAAPNHAAVVAGETRLTYAALNALADQLADGFLSLGLPHGARVLVQLPNAAEFVTAAFGLIRAGLVPVFTLPAHRRTEIEHFARVSEAVGYIGSDRHDGFDYREMIGIVSAAVPTLEHVFIVGDAGSHHALSSLLDRPYTGPRPEIRSSDVALMQLSGGSTGLSKLIPRTHDDYAYSFRASADICGLTATSVYMATLPAAHNFTMSSPGWLGTLATGATVVMCPSPAPEVAFPLIASERVTITSVVPPLALTWLDAAASMAPDFASLQILQVGGAKLTPEVARRVKPTFGVDLQQVFGMAEGLVNYTRIGDPDDVVVYTQGRPISPSDEVLIVDDHGQPVPDGTPGHLLTRGPYTIRAYHNDPAANAAAFTDDGYYRTGDVVARDAAGYLTVHGRAGDHINRGGEKVSAEEIEDHLLAHPQVHDAAVVSVPDAYLGERACAFIVPRGEAPRAPDLRRWMRDRGIAAFKIPDKIVFVDAFPATGVGKTSRRDLRAALRDKLN